MSGIRPDIVVVIPVYNHGRTVFEVIDRCLEIHDRILVVNDGSTDLDMEKVAQSRVEWIHHPKNMGKGAAILSGAEAAAKGGATHIITIDADLQHDPGDIAVFKKAVEQDPLALFVGKRDFGRAEVPGASRFGRQFSNFWFRVQTGFKIADAQSGFRAYPLFLFDHLSLTQNHYAFEVEILVKASWAGISVKDLDISVHYPTGKARVSHFRLIMDNLRLTHLNSLLTLRSFLPVPHKRIFPDDRPKFSILRPVQSTRQLVSYHLSPFEIAMAAGAGAFLSAPPLIGFRVLTILFVTGFFRLNKWVAIGTSQIGIPPFVPALCIELGYFLTHKGRFLTEISFETLGYQAVDRLYEWFLGSLIVAPALGVAAFCVVYIIALTVYEKDQEKA